MSHLSEFENGNGWAKVYICRKSSLLCCVIYFEICPPHTLINTIVSVKAYRISTLEMYNPFTYTFKHDCLRPYTSQQSRISLNKKSLFFCLWCFVCGGYKYWPNYNRILVEHDYGLRWNTYNLPFFIFLNCRFVHEIFFYC